MSEVEKKLTEAQERLEESYAEGRRAEGQLQALQEQLTEGQQHTAQLQADLASRTAQLAAEHQVRLLTFASGLLCKKHPYRLKCPV